MGLKSLTKLHIGRLWFVGKEKERKCTGDIFELCRELTCIKLSVGGGGREVMM